MVVVTAVMKVLLEKLLIIKKDGLVFVSCVISFINDVIKKSFKLI